MSNRTSKEKYSSGKATGGQKPNARKMLTAPKVEPSSYYDKMPTWLFQRFDFKHKKWGLDYNAKILTAVFTYLSHLEKMAWSEILTTTSGRSRNTRHHNISLTDLSRDAQKRAAGINADEFDRLCSIAIDSTIRVWGHISDGLFYIIWIDPDHEIYQVETY
jgi:hypothetical protein